jgi:hypothetical protein
LGGGAAGSIKFNAMSSVAVIEMDWQFFIK